MLIGDFLEDGREFARTVAALSAEGAAGQALMIADPIEETFPFVGHTEFVAPGGAARLRAPRAQGLREAYLTRLAAHRELIRGACAAQGWGLAPHRTDQPAAQALLALRMRLEGPAAPGQAGR